ncbi:MAG: iron complex transport system substrate-binding protein [Thermoproteota archaeon]|nr:iron complex transport system substrate-binding protein [Thermoproteota archaeon]
MNRNRIIAIAIGVIIIASVSGYYLYGSVIAPALLPKTRTVTDARGAQVTIPYEVKKVLTLREVHTEMCIVLGAEDKLVGIDDGTKANRSYGVMNVKLRPAIQSLPCPISGKSLNLEQIVALKPDVIFIGGYGRLSWIDTLKPTNISVVVAHFEEIGNYTRDLKIMGEVLGKQDKANEISTHINSILSAVSSRVGNISQSQKISAYFSGNDLYHVYGSTTFEHFQIVTAGGTNVASSITTWLPAVSPEQLISWNPNVIFTLESVNKMSVLQDPNVQTVSAIQNQKVFPIPQGGWDFGSLRAIFAIEWLSTKLYPARWSDVNITNAANTFYQNVYKINYWGPSLA